jgi:hypothetical protein
MRTTITPGFAKPRSELPWLPYRENDKVFVINSHNFTPAFSPAVNGKMPIAAWIPSRDDSGNGTTTLTDLVGSANGTLTNMDAATDWVADTGAGGVRALDFDGANDFVNCGLVGSPSVFSMVGWFKPSNIVGAEMLVAQRSHQTTAALMRTQWFINGTNVHCRVFSGLSASGWRGVIASGVVAADWQHYGFVYNGGTDIKCFVNGVEQSVTTESGGAAFASINTGVVPVTIGVQNADGIPGNYYAGRLDDIRIFDQALTATDIADLYAAGLGRGIDAS